MPVTVNLRTVHPRKLAAVRREVAPGAIGSAWEPAIGKVWRFIRSQAGLWADGHNIFLYHHPTRPGAPIISPCSAMRICRLPQLLPNSILCVQNR